jgi:hypothetical protein
MTRSCGLNFFIWSCLAAWSALWLAGTSPAATTIGNWENGQADGWIDWGGGQLPISPPSYAFNPTGATLGSKAVQFNEPSDNTYAQWLGFKLQAGANGRGTGSDANSGGPGVIRDYRPDFMANSKIAFDLTLVRSEQDSNPSSNFTQINLFALGPGWGFGRLGKPIPGDAFGNRAPDSITPLFNGYAPNTNYWDPTQLGATPQTSTWVYDLSAAKAAMPLDPGSLGGTVPAYVELVFDIYSVGPAKLHVDNVRLFNVPEPASLVLVGVALPGGFALVIRRRARKR